MFKEITVPGHVAAESVDGETIIIDFITGSYHTLEGRAADVWSRISSAEIESISSVDAMVIADFARAGIITIANSLNLPPASSDPTESGLKSYNDMAAILLADPIHEVDAQGWPKLRDDIG